MKKSWFMFYEFNLLSFMVGVSRTIEKSSLGRVGTAKYTRYTVSIPFILLAWESREVENEKSV